MLFVLWTLGPRWSLHLNEPACVVGEHRQLLFAEFCRLIWPDVGDTVSVSCGISIFICLLSILIFLENFQCFQQLNCFWSGDEEKTIQIDIAIVKSWCVIFLSFSVTREIIHSINKSHLYYHFSESFNHPGEMKTKKTMNKDPITWFYLFIFPCLHLNHERWWLWKIFQGVPHFYHSTYSCSISSTIAFMIYQKILFLSTTYLIKIVHKHKLYE